MLARSIIILLLIKTLFPIIQLEFLNPLKNLWLTNTLLHFKVEPLRKIFKTIWKQHKQIRCDPPMICGLPALRTERGWLYHLVGQLFRAKLKLKLSVRRLQTSHSRSIQLNYRVSKRELYLNTGRNGQVFHLVDHNLSILHSSYQENSTINFPKDLLNLATFPLRMKT